MLTIFGMIPYEVKYIVFVNYKVFIYQKIQLRKKKKVLCV